MRGAPPRHDGPGGQPGAGQRAPEQCSHEGGGDRQPVDRLHGGDALPRWQSAECGHDEGREREEDTSAQAAAQRRPELRHPRQQAGHRPPSRPVPPDAGAADPRVLTSLFMPPS